VAAKPKSSNAAHTARSKAAESVAAAALFNASIVAEALCGGSTGMTSGSKPVVSTAGQSSTGRLSRKRRSASSVMSGLRPRPNVRSTYCESAV
jgi:hypothetical protein